MLNLMMKIIFVVKIIFDEWTISERMSIIYRKRLNWFWIMERIGEIGEIEEMNEERRNVV